MRLLLTLGLLGLITPAAPATPPLAVAKVPGDAFAFGHFRFSQLWDHPLVEKLRAILGNNLGRDLAIMQKRAGIEAANLDAFTVYISRINRPGNAQLYCVILTTRKPYDRDRVIRAGGNTKPDVRGFFELDEHDPDGLLLHLSGPRTFALMHPALAEDYAKAGPALAEGPIHEALKSAATGEHAAVASLNMATSPRGLILADPPAELRPYLPLLKVDTVFAEADLGDDIKVRVRVNAAETQNVVELEESLTTLIPFGQEVVEDHMIERQKYTRERDKPQLHLALALLRMAKETLGAVKITRSAREVELAGVVQLDPKLVDTVAKAVK